MTKALYIFCVFLFVGGLLYQFAPLKTFNFLIPKDAGSRLRMANIAYGPETQQRLDIYEPATKSGLKPVLVFVHGGSWQEGNKADYEFVGRAFAARGYLKHVGTFHIVSFCGTALVLQHMLQELKGLQRTPLNTIMVDPSLALALPHLYEKRRAAGRPLPLSWATYWRMKHHMVRKFGLVTPKVGPDGRFIRAKNTGRYLGSAEHHNDIHNRWGANLKSALAADTAYTLMLQEDCPPQVDEAVHIITSTSFWQGRSRLDVDAVRIFVPQAQWHNLQVQSHLDLIANHQIHMARVLREIMLQSGAGTAVSNAL